ncbi:MAG TPA: peptidoglycan DD-metalloendopeptidase family protein [Candidatus Acidoferrum sp.]|nr:peptidoglycan DD-metalloendopeptidase family protein [Candidatus Acidoferrum sp.]
MYKFSGLRGAVPRTGDWVRSWRRRHWLVAALTLTFTATAGVVTPRFANATHDADDAPMLSIELAVPPLPNDIVEAQQALAAAENDDFDWSTVTVHSGQTVGDIFRQQGISASDLQKLTDIRANAAALRNIHPGQEFAFARGDNGVLKALRFDRDEHTRVTENYVDGGFRETVQDRGIERRTHVAHGVVERSLFESGNQAGLSDAMVLKLATAFGYDIDFAQDLRQGDSFTVIYDDVYCEGEHMHDGDIIAATFINRGKRFSAFRYTDATGSTMYYSGDGRPLRKEFLRTPVEFTRISSMFTAGRMHPILGTMRAHRGVDYAAPSGTPIHAAGEGKVAFRGWQGGYGNVVILQHGGHYSTLYGHMSKIAAIKVGQHVSQGQTIGFVGMTGLATGPHLHYEFRVDGTHRDPLTVTLPKPEPLPSVELAKFQQTTSPMLAKLKTLEATQIAVARQ